MLRLVCAVLVPGTVAYAQRTEPVEVPTSRGFNARVFVSIPPSSTARHAAIVVIPWLSCDPVQLDRPGDDGFLLFVRDLTATNQFVVARIEKPGVADSGGPDCSVSTLDDDFAAFRAGLRAVLRRPDVDTTNVFLVGVSIGGAFAVALAAEEQGRIAGVVSVNSFARTWYEHMIDHERRRLTLLNTPPDRFGEVIRALEQFYTGFLIDGKTPGGVIAAHPELRSVWYDTTVGQYGRAAAYFHQVQALDTDRALATLDVPALFISGEFDWVMGSNEAAVGAARMNRFHPGRAEVRIYAGTSHGLHRFATLDDAFHGRHGTYNRAVATDVGRWLIHHAHRRVRPRTARRGS